MQVSVLSWEGNVEILLSFLGRGWKSSWSEILRIKMSLLLHRAIVHRKKRLFEKKLQGFLLIHHTQWLLVFKLRNLFLIIIYAVDFFLLWNENSTSFDAPNSSSSVLSISYGVLYLTFTLPLTLFLFSSSLWWNIPHGWGHLQQPWLPRSLSC